MVDNLSALKRFALHKVPDDGDAKDTCLWAVLLVFAIRILWQKGGLVKLCQSNGFGKAADLTDISNIDSVVESFGGSGAKADASSILIHRSVRD